MKNKKGFTLVEILGVITIISVLALIAIPTIDNIVTKNREKLYDAQIKTIEDGLKTWADANAISLPEDGDDALLLSLGVLKLAGFVDEDIKNPNTNLCFSNDMMVSIAAVKEGYTYYVDEESGLDGTEVDCSAPTATNFLYLKGSSTINLALNSTYEEPGYLALNGSGNIVTSQVTTLIRDKNSQIVSSIDTSEATTSPYTITYTIGEVSKTRTIVVKIGDPIGTVYAFDYTGAVQNINLNSGSYKLEVWGAQGGGTGGGTGGYSIGTVTLTNETPFYIYSGGTGSVITTDIANGGFNGGGGNYSTSGTTGGGASDIRIVTDSLYSRVIVAGGGGGGGWNGSTPSGAQAGGTGGGNSGTNGIANSSWSTYAYGLGGTQITGGSSTGISSGGGGQLGAITNGVFGVGGKGSGSSSGGAGGGGGWYGGGPGMINAGGGGSGWIYTSSTFTTWQTGNATDAANWLLNSSYYLSNTQTIAGNASMPTHDGTGTMTGNSGNGYVKITKIG